MNRLREEVELEKNVRRLREKFHGKIAIDKATILMRRYGNNHRVVAMDIILMKDRDLDDEDRENLQNDEVARNVVERLEAEEQAGGQDQPQPRQPRPRPRRAPREDRDINDVAEQLRTLPLTQENLRMFDNAQQNLMISVLCQFACQACDFDWWRRVPERKKVSRCRRCKRKYDAVPPDRMWGLAEFQCGNCGRSFRGFGRMDLGSPCYTCRSLVTPTRILPPGRRLVGLGFRRANQHSCLAEDCYNRQEPHVPGTECVHPRSRMMNRKPRIVNPSEVHISSGSTVNTCLSQGSLMDLYEILLEDIQEERHGEEESGSGGPSGSEARSSSSSSSSSQD
ncbi:shiftless antiviral inhibitor of ribosomal frameshifting protein homolog isoform X1 [Brienomyrus brachyistius]|uniref:shiftless antiviral inhibitor of ribosomal frameshifting protein homolog isoform X1 n=1 Tax=Brienomyrus brachyistius TaxID=42636 RepID=UPI0020B44926|nr:shiftless antiviral inhibitor of ribosomal frameshifting protein homolog isoform X1 [Brienomyrus brachyistius]